MNRKPVIIDCDPGADDFLSILLALTSPELEVLGITTVCGNSNVENTTWNATRACLFAGSGSVKVYQGAAKPLQRDLEYDTSYGGEDGLCCSPLHGDAAMIGEGTAKEFLTETLNSAVLPVTIISTASMTNLALAIRDTPGITENIAEITTISGYYGFSKEFARAEWNILVDPEAAEIVYSSGVRIRAAGLDVSGRLKDCYVSTLIQDKTGITRDFIAHATAYNTSHGLSAYSILVDAMATAIAIAPDIAGYREGAVSIHSERSDSGLMTFSGIAGGNRRKNVSAAYTFDAARYLQLLKDRIFL